MSDLNVSFRCLIAVKSDRRIPDETTPINTVALVKDSTQVSTTVGVVSVVNSDVAFFVSLSPFSLQVTSLIGYIPRDVAQVFQSWISSKHQDG